MPAEATTATPPPPATTPPPQPPAEKAPQDYLGDITSELADMDAGKPIPPRGDDGKFKPAEKATKPVEKPTTAKPAEKPAENPEEEVAVEAPEKPAEKPVEKPAEVKPVKAADLRAAYEGLKKKVKEEWEPQVQSLKAKVAELESRKPEDSAPIVAKLKALESRNAELEKQIEYVDYSQSKEFTDKYAKPYQDAWTDAVAEFRELTVREVAGTDPTTDEPIIKTRPADENDLLKLANMRLSDMDAAATEMFGPSASRAINHIQSLKKLSAAQSKALQEAKTKATEVRSQREIEQKTREQNTATMWSEVNKSLKEKFPKAFDVDAADPDDKAAHARGFALADLMFNPTSITPEQVDQLPPSIRETVKTGKPLTDVQIVQLKALARLKIANHDRKVAALKKATARIAELEKTVAEYESSGPPAGKAGASETTDTTKDWMAAAADELKALDR